MVFGAHVFLDVEERRETKVRDLFAPFSFHPLDAQVLKEKILKRSGQTFSQLKMIVFPSMGHFFMGPSQARFGPSPVVRPLLFGREVSARFFKDFQGVLKKQRGLDLVPSTGGQKSLEPEIKTTTDLFVTTSDSLGLDLVKVASEEQIEVP
jgi:hypothetical protein